MYTLGVQRVVGVDNDFDYINKHRGLGVYNTIKIKQSRREQTSQQRKEIRQVSKRGTPYSMGRVRRSTLKSR